MAKSKDKVGLAPPMRMEVLGENEPVPAVSAIETTAVVVFHGMGQQVKFETVDMLAQALIDAHEAGGGQSEKRVRQVWCDDKEGGRFLPRVEVELQDAKGNIQKRVHVYESYWAPLTQEAISFFSTASFFLRAGWRGICASRNDESRFLRWAFGSEHAFPLARGTYGHLIVVTLLLALLVVVLVGSGYWLWPPELKRSISLDAVLKAGFSTLLWAAALYVTWRTRRWMVQYLGDVAIYLSSSELDKYWRLSDEIKRECHRVPNAVYRAVALDESKVRRFQYNRVVVAGHSLGSVIAYDTLNSLVQRDLANDSRMAVQAVFRTKTLLTFGSPLDKVAFIFGTQVTGRKMREALAGGVQPLIVDYKYRPAKWVNIYAKGDVIAGRLDYFDDPKNGDGRDRRVQNEIDGEASWFPPRAHTDYWTHGILKRSLYELVMGNSV